MVHTCELGVAFGAGKSFFRRAADL
jgi:hypothetical protein